MAVFSVEISTDSAERLRALDQFHFDLHFRAARQEAPNRFVVPGILTDEQIDAVQAAGYGVQRVADLAQVAAQRAQEVSTQDRFAPLATVAEVAAATAMGYLTVEEVDSAFQTLASAHPDLVQMIELPERTWEDRVCRAVRLRAGAAGERVGVLFTGSIHAREWGGSDILVSLVTRLVDAYVSSTPLVYGGKSFSAEQVQAILERLDLFVLPDVNPDGKQFSQTNDPGSGPQGFWWRKNRNPNNESGGGAVGVDLNRNFDFLWASGIGTSDDPSTFIYKGTSSFSEPESRNIRYLFDAYPNIRFYVDVHCFSELILYSWGDDDTQTMDPEQNFRNPAFDGVWGVPNDTAYREYMAEQDRATLETLANRMNAALNAVRGKSYTVGPAVGLYPTTATTCDYAFSRHRVDPGRAKVYAFVIEFGREFVPPFAEMQEIMHDVGSALTELCWAASSAAEPAL